jgi:hypothetical protein
MLAAMYLRTGRQNPVLAGALRLRSALRRFTNPTRPHSALAYRSPVEFERDQKQEKRNAEWMPARMSFPRHREIYPDASNH